MNKNKLENENDIKIKLNNPRLKFLIITESLTPKYLLIRKYFLLFLIKFFIKKRFKKNIKNIVVNKIVYR